MTGLCKSKCGGCNKTKVICSHALPIPSLTLPLLQPSGVVAALHDDADMGIDPVAKRVTLALERALSGNASLAVLEQRYLTAAALLASPAGIVGSGWGAESLAPSLRSGQCYALLQSLCLAVVSRWGSWRAFP